MLDIVLLNPGFYNCIELYIEQEELALAKYKEAVNLESSEHIYTDQEESALPKHKDAVNPESSEHLRRNPIEDIVERVDETCTMTINNDFTDDLEFDDIDQPFFEEDNIDDDENDDNDINMPSARYHQPPGITPTVAPEIANVSQYSLNFDITQWNSTEEVELRKGLIFASQEYLKRAVKLYSIKAHRQYRVIESKRNYWILRCKMESECGCKWRLRATKMKRHGYFEITQYNGPHTCVYPALSRDHRQLDSNMISVEVEGIVRGEPSINIAALTNLIVDKYHYTVSYKKVWYAKQKAIERIFGGWDESYASLPRFMNALQFYNKGTVVEWKYCQTGTDTIKFQRVFWAFGPSIAGFEHCRPLICIDGTHLYGKYRGKILIAMAVDGNDQLFPLAFAIVAEESTESWSWFLFLIRKKVTQRRGLCLISDRHAGILKAVTQHGWKDPDAHHRFCLRHLCSNFNDKFHNTKLKSLVWQAGSQAQVRKFNRVMDEIGSLSLEARQWLERIPLVKWSLAHDGGRRYGILTTNGSEVYNAVIKGARNLPITACIELIFQRVVKYFNDRRCYSTEAMSCEQQFTPQVLMMLEKNAAKANAHELVSYNRQLGIFDVKTAPGHRRMKGRNKQVVNLAQYSCTCGKFDQKKYPCSHVLAVCQQCAIDRGRYVENYYTINEYAKTWEGQFYPLLHQDYWPASAMPTLCPDPELKSSKPGRRKSSRIHNEMDLKEGQGPIHCGLCKATGHNRRRCPNKK